jgi:hypothetical protein
MPGLDPLAAVGCLLLAEKNGQAPAVCPVTDAMPNMFFGAS